MVTFYDYPREHWRHLRTTNPVESPFAALRLRTDAARRYKRGDRAIAVIWKMLMVAEKRFRRLQAPELMEDVYHGFITDRYGDTLELESGHRRHAEIENVIRDLKHGVGLNHLPSGRFAANAAWLAVQVMAHNLARWTVLIGLGEQVITTRTLRRRFLSMAGRLTRSARPLTLHLPKRWPWETQFSRALARLRALPFPT